jgi:integrase
MFRTPPRHAPKLLDQVREHLRVLHDSIRTEDSYVNWIKRFLLFLCRVVLERPLGERLDAARAKRPERLPVVLSRDEVRAVLDGLDGVHRLMAGLLHGAGLRLMGCLRLRV